MDMTVNQKDVDFLRMRMIAPDRLKHYREILNNGFPHMELAANCQAASEIKQFDDKEKSRLRNLYRTESKNKRILKFVPASGAASRMFKEMFAFLENGKESEGLKSFFEHLNIYPFSKELSHLLRNDQEKDDSWKREVIRHVLFEEGLNYAELPKGLIAFHKYSDGDVRTAFEEHFYEAKMYATSNDEAFIHFTIPENSQDAVVAFLKKLNTKLSKSLGVNFKIQTSIQKPSTDTPAIYEDDGEWARDENGDLLLRPAGHGALLENLNDLDADIVFVKNIDNVVPDRLKDVTVEYKELLAGVLIEVQNDLFRFIEEAEMDGLDREACNAFFKKWFLNDVSHLSKADLVALMNRPTRVCGMVKNQGEPGGGPFLVQEQNREKSLQVVESAQVNQDDESQQNLLSKASHFNPVDLVVGLKDYQGDAFNLIQYRNANTGMVVSKNYHGRNIKALELPGLWNGSMHNWNTVFVEVPIETFNPVKTVFDLARPQHQS